MERGRWGESCCRGLVWSFYEVHPLHSRQALNGHTIIQVGRACEKGCEPERKWRSPCRTLPQHLVASPDNKAKDFQSCNSDIYFDSERENRRVRRGLTPDSAQSLSFFLSFPSLHFATISERFLVPHTDSEKGKV